MKAPANQFGAEMLQNFKSFGNWIVVVAIPFLWKHWKWTWLAIASFGSMVSMAVASLGTTAAWIMLTIAAIITILDKWVVVLEFIGQMFSNLLTALINVMIGGKGVGWAMFTNGAVIFTVAFLFFGNSNSGITTAAIGALLVIGSMIYGFDKAVKKVSSKKYG